MFENLFAWIKSGVSQAVSEGLVEGVQNGIARVANPLVLDVEAEPVKLPAPVQSTTANGKARKSAVAR